MIRQGSTQPKRLVANFKTLTPLFNKSNISSTEYFNATVEVPLPPSVRANGTLYATTIIVRAGLDPDPSTHDAYNDWRQEDWRRTILRAHPYRDLMWTCDTLTRHMVPLRKNTSNLLADIVSNNTDLPPGSLRIGLPTQLADALTPIHPVFNKTLTLHPFETTAWFSLFFGVTGFYQPTVPLAVVRMMLLAISPYMYTLYQKNIAFEAEEAQKAMHTLEGMLQGSPKDPVTHWWVVRYCSTPPSL